ncbi:MAG: ribonuclease PH [Anaerolineae bacterium]|nr:ribonuclease PH [Anaerolineae bacterium]
MRRTDGRAPSELRPVSIVPHYLEFADGSALIICGRTKVLCAATVEESVPSWLEGQGSGWVTAEYALLPRSTQTRTPRERGSGSGRSQEIRRLIGRALRASVDLDLLGPRRIIVDCDVIQADGGTRTAAITGGYVALHLALQRLIAEGIIPQEVLRAAVAAVSVGLVAGEPLLDLCYEEDAQAAVDMNVVMNAAGEFVEIQGTAEGHTFSRDQLEELLSLAEQGIARLLEIQHQALAAAGNLSSRE